MCMLCFSDVAPPPSSCVEVLLSAGAAVDSAAAGGLTSLFLACEAGGLDCVRVLLSAGADRSRTTTVSLRHHAGHWSHMFSTASDLNIRKLTLLTWYCKKTCHHPPLE